MSLLNTNLGRPAMIQETATNLDPSWGELVDLDLVESTEWVGVFRTSDGLAIRTPTACVQAPAGIRYPLIRRLDDSRCVLVDTRTARGRVNGWVISPRTNETLPFFPGDGIADVLANGNAIVVTYFDEGVLSGIEPGSEGIAIFTGEGRLRAGYQTSLGSEAVDTLDCYAACWEDDTTIAFLPYTGFPLVRLDIGSLEQEVKPTPRSIHGASALSITSDTALFYSPYDLKTSLISWASAVRPVPIGKHPGPLRGLRSGRFISLGTSGFTVVDAAQPEGAGGPGPRLRSEPGR
jgi:hypothetical protein